MSYPLPIHGRGTAENPANRFEPMTVEVDGDYLDAEPDAAARAGRATQYFVDASRSVIVRNDSPDIPYEHSLNPYRGCAHGCIYCYARPTHEYLGFSSGLDFETKILVKRDAPELLRAELSRRSWQGQPVSIGGVTDPYQPVERALCITRRCLEVLAEFRNPCSVVTKNRLVTRDLDLLASMAGDGLAHAFISITTLDADLTRVMEPRTSVPRDRLGAIRQLSAAGVPVGVLTAPVIPGLTDHEVPAILAAAREAGARAAGYVMLRLPFAVKDLFATWLRQHRPDRADKVLNRVRDVRGGKLNDSTFKRRMRGGGPFADHVADVFKLTCRRLGLNEDFPELRTDLFCRPLPPGGQLGLFE